MWEWCRLHSKFLNLWREKEHSRWVWNIPWCVYPTYGTFARYRISFVYRQLGYCSATWWSIVSRRHQPYRYCTMKSKVFTQRYQTKTIERDSIACRKEKSVCVGWQDKNVPKLNRPQFMVKLVEGCWTVISELVEWNLEGSQLKIHKTDCYFLKNI